MGISVLSVGQLEVNCCLLWQPRTDRGLIVDPGDDPAMIIKEINGLGFSPEAILLTHGHVDHIRGVSETAAAFGCPVWLHSADYELYKSPANALPPWLPAAENLPEPANWNQIAFDDWDVSVLHTPGHTPGGCYFYFKQENLLLAGDTLFAGSVGRTDLAGGDHNTLISSIREQLAPLPEETRVISGHGQETTIGAEKRTNPFL